jgi:hypothetical protein
LEIDFRFLCTKGQDRANRKLRKVFFFVNKKEAKKLLFGLVRAVETPDAQNSKSFLVLFFKKERLTYFLSLIRLQDNA